VTTSVYTDSGYTTKSVKYADLADSYLVLERENGGGGGGGVFVDYDRIKKLITDEVKKIKIPKPAEIPTIEIPAPDFTEITKSFEKMYKKLDKPPIKIPEPEKVDYDKIEGSTKKNLEKMLAENKKETEKKIKDFADQLYKTLQELRV
jgi:hypothetical protein